MLHIPWVVSKMDDSMNDLQSIIEALIFASPEPVTLKMLVKLLDEEPTENIEEALAAIIKHWDRNGGLQLVEVAGGYQIAFPIFALFAPQWKAEALELESLAAVEPEPALIEMLSED